jgi:hypothetical protein
VHQKWQLAPLNDLHLFAHGSVYFRTGSAFQTSSRGSRNLCLRFRARSAMTASRENGCESQLWPRPWGRLASHMTQSNRRHRRCKKAKKREGTEGSDADDEHTWDGRVGGRGRGYSQREVPNRRWETRERTTGRREVPSRQLAVAQAPQISCVTNISTYQQIHDPTMCKTPLYCAFIWRRWLRDRECIHF